VIRVLGIGASPRAGGNTIHLLDEALRGASGAGASTSKVILNDLSFKPCQACGGCDATGRCVIHDDMDRVYEAFAEADGIAIASPLYFGNVSAQLKAMIDRFQCEWVRLQSLKGKPSRPRQGIFLCAGGSGDHSLFEHAQRTVRIFYNATGTSYVGGVFCGGVEEPGAARKDQQAMADASRLGQVLGKGIA